MSAKCRWLSHGSGSSPRDLRRLRPAASRSTRSRRPAPRADGAAARSSGGRSRGRRSGRGPPRPSPGRRPSPRELRVGVLERLDAVGGMQVERRVQPLLVDPGEEPARVGEQLAVPGVAGPAVRRVPVHVDHEHVERQVVRAEVGDQRRGSGVAVGPVARPPGAEHEARDERDRPAEARVLADRAGVVVAVAEEVPVLVVRALGPRLDPAVLAREDDAGCRRTAPSRSARRAPGRARAPPRTRSTVRRAPPRLCRSTVPGTQRKAGGSARSTPGCRRGTAGRPACSGARGCRCRRPSRRPRSRTVNGGGSARRCGNA